MKYLLKATELRPNDGFIIDSLGWVYFKLKRYDDAVAQLEKAVKLVSNDATIQFHLAEAYFVKGDYRLALPLYRKVLQQEPKLKDVSERIRQIKAEIGEK